MNNTITTITTITTNNIHLPYKNSPEFMTRDETSGYLSPAEGESNWESAVRAVHL